jgi:5-formyltetrahydrofolate cyclo-ligase
MSPRGVRLGYGHGFYDKFLAENKTTTIVLTLEKQIVKNIPKSEHDVIIDWIVTEDRIFQTQK